MLRWPSRAAGGARGRGARGASRFIRSTRRPVAWRPSSERMRATPLPDHERHSATELGMGSAARNGGPGGQPRGPGAGRGAARQRLFGAGSPPDRSPVDAVLYDTAAVSDGAEGPARVAELADHGVISIAVAGGRITPPRRRTVADGPALLCRSRRCAPLGGAQAERALCAAGLESTRLSATGDRLRAAVTGSVRGLGVPSPHARWLVLTGSPRAPAREPPETAIARDRGESGVALRRAVGDRLRERQVVALLRVPDGEEFFMPSLRRDPLRARSTPRSWLWGRWRRTARRKWSASASWSHAQRARWGR